MKTLSPLVIFMMWFLVITSSIIQAQDTPIIIHHDSSQINLTPDSIVFTVVDQMPQFPDGDEARIKYLKENIIYPSYAKTKCIQGRVFVSFIVEKDGSISEAKVFKGIGGGCDEEALRVIESMPNWQPGVLGGKPVRVQFMMPIHFNLNTVKTKETPDYAFEKGVKLMNKKSYEKAINKFSKSISAKGSKYKESFAKRGVCKYYTEDYDGALSDLQLSINFGVQINNKIITQLYFNIANEYFDIDLIEQAIELYTKAITLTPENGDIYFNRGVAYYNSGNIEQACADWQTAKKLGIENIDKIIDEGCK